MPSGYRYGCYGGRCWDRAWSAYRSVQNGHAAVLELGRDRDAATASDRSGAGRRAVAAEVALTAGAGPAMDYLGLAGNSLSSPQAYIDAVLGNGVLPPSSSGFRGIEGMH